MPRSELVQSVTRALDILWLLSGTPGGMALRDIAAALRMKPPTVHQLLRTLAARGFVEKTLDPVRYRVGAAVWQVAEARWGHQLVEKAPAILQRLAERFPEAVVTFTQAIGTEVMAMLRMTPERPGFLERPRERVMQPYNTASSLVFQAFWNEETRGAYRRRYPFEGYGTHRWKNQEEVEQFIAGIRTGGYALLPGTGENLCAIAAPVLTERGIQGALGVALPVSADTHRNRQAAVREVLRSAQELSSFLLEESS